MNSIYLCRAIPLEQDSRALRFYQLLEDEGCAPRVVQWGASQNSALDPKSKVVVAPLPRVRAKPWLNLLLTPLFSLWLLFYFLFKVRRTDRVFAIDLDTALPAYLASRIKGFRYFFDIADPYSAGRLRRSWAWIDWLEGKVAAAAHLALIPADCRRRYYACALPLVVIENVALAAQAMIELPVPSSERMRIGYFGALEPDDRLLELLVAVVAKRTDTDLDLAGSGGLAEFCRQAAETYPHIRFHGAYQPDTLALLVQPCDLLFAAYSLRKQHHQCIAANKLYEHLYFGRPLLTNSGTNLAVQVLAWGTGWEFDERPESLDQLLTQLRAADPAALIAKAQTARTRWLMDYQSYWQASLGVQQLRQALGQTDE